VREAAKLLSDTGAFVLAAAIPPYGADRQQIKAALPRCLLGWVATASAVCESRDVKGMWALARVGRLSGFTGVDDPYETPVSPDVTIRTETQTPAESARIVLDALRERGWT